MLEAFSKGDVPKNSLKDNTTLGVVLSLFRSRDDNLIWVASNFLYKVLKSQTEESLNSLELLDKSKPGSHLFTLLVFIFTLLTSENQFRLATVRSLGTLLTELISLSKLTSKEISSNTFENLKNLIKSKVDQLEKLLTDKQLGKLTMVIYHKNYELFWYSFMNSAR